MPHGALKGAPRFECVPHAQVCCAMTNAHGREFYDFIIPNP